MAPPMAVANLILGYPVYASDFDRQNSDFLIVGGGGGEGGHGVGNKITLLDASKKQALSEVVDIELSRDEDSVTSLAAAQSIGSASVIFAGINSSIKEQEAGKNEHLRSFKLELPKRRRTEEEEEEAANGTAEKPAAPPTTEAFAKVSLFRTAPGEKETYQRVLRLSRPVRGSNARMGAIATGLAPAGEVVVFDASKTAPTGNDVRKRVRLDKGEEAADLDIIERAKGEYLLAYCTSYEVFVCSVATSAKAKSLDPRLLHGIPIPDVFTGGKRSQFRSLRFLTPRLLVLVLNLPGRTGTELLLLDVPEDKALQGSIILRKRLHKGIKSATSLATALLPGPTPTSNVQHVLAIAGQDTSLTILTLDHAPTSIRALSFRTHSCLKNHHSMQMTSLSFSNFTPPSTPGTSGPQYLKLASTSMAASVFVHTFPLTPYPAVPKKEKDEATRYTLQSPGTRTEQAQMGISVLFAVLMVAFGAFLLQAFTEIRGGTPEYLGAKNWLHKGIHDRIARPYMFADSLTAPVIVESMPPVIEHVRSKASEGAEVVKSAVPDAEAVKSVVPDAEEVVESLPVGLKQALLSRKEGDGAGQAVVVRSGEEGLSTEVHHDEEVASREARKWEDLEHHERKAWKERLVEAGEWAADEGETVLKGVFFGQVAGAVAGALNG